MERRIAPMTSYPDVLTQRFILPAILCVLALVLIQKLRGNRLWQLPRWKPAESVFARLTSFWGIVAFSFGVRIYFQEGNFQTSWDSIKSFVDDISRNAKIKSDFDDSPLYTYWGYFFFKVLNLQNANASIVFFNMLIGSVTNGIMLLTLRLAMPRITAGYVGLILSVFLPFIIWESVIRYDIVHRFFLILSFYFLLRLFYRNDWLIWLALAVASSAAVFSKETSAYLLGPVLLFTITIRVWTSETIASRVKLLSMGLVILVAIVIPHRLRIEQNRNSFNTDSQKGVFNLFVNLYLGGYLKKPSPDTPFPQLNKQAVEMAENVQNLPYNELGRGQELASRLLLVRDREGKYTAHKEHMQNAMHLLLCDPLPFFKGAFHNLLFEVPQIAYDYQEDFYPRIRRQFHSNDILKALHWLLDRCFSVFLPTALLVIATVIFLPFPPQQRFSILTLQAILLGYSLILALGTQSEFWRLMGPVQFIMAGNIFLLIGALVHLQQYLTARFPFLRTNPVNGSD